MPPGVTRTAPNARKSVPCSGGNKTVWRRASCRASGERRASAAVVGWSSHTKPDHGRNAHERLGRSRIAKCWSHTCTTNTHRGMPGGRAQHGHEIHHVIEGCCLPPDGRCDDVGRRQQEQRLPPRNALLRPSFRYRGRFSAADSRIALNAASTSSFTLDDFISSGLLMGGASSRDILTFPHTRKNKRTRHEH